MSIRYGNTKGWMTVRGHKIRVHIGEIFSREGGRPRAYVRVIDERVSFTGLAHNDPTLLYSLRVGELRTVYAYKRVGERPIAVSTARLQVDR